MSIVIHPHNGFIPKYVGDGNTVYSVDHMPDNDYIELEYDFETDSVYNDVDYNTYHSLFSKNNISPEIVYNETYLKWKNFGYNWKTCPVAFLRDCDAFLDSAELYDHSDTYTSFTMMNKERPNRVLVSGWLANNIHDAQYTQGFDFNPIKYKELVRNTEYTDTSLGLSKKWIPYKKQVSGDPYNYKNVDLYNNLLSEYYTNSTLTIVTEPVFYEKASIITEKYLMALYGFCFPIFCGGYGVADDIEEIGFDTFSDVIDHSYQYAVHPSDRILDALHLNRHLLSGNSELKKTDFLSRHKRNLCLVRDELEQLKSKLYNHFDNDVLVWFDNYQQKLV